VLSGGIALPFALQALLDSEVQGTVLGPIPFLDDRANPNTITEDADTIIPFDLTRLKSWVTPEDKFYIRNHFPIPKVSNASDWNISVNGHVKHKQRLLFGELQALPHVEHFVTLECAGNSKRRNHGLVSNAKWSGVPVSVILENVGLKSTATHVVFRGKDSSAAGGDSFARSLSISEVMRPEVILATKMNDKPLPPEHGFPVRLIVPGWYGMAHVKWLDEIEVIDRPFHGKYQTTFYVNQLKSSVEGLGSEEAWRPSLITKIPVKSLIARVQRNYHKVGNVYQISGAVWGGHSPIRSVYIKIKGSSDWSPVVLKSHNHLFAWTLWSYEWRDPTLGNHSLLSRGIDGKGLHQPARRSSRVRGPYENVEIVTRRVNIS